MKRDAVKSSNLRSVGYELLKIGDKGYKPHYGTLEIEFNSGGVYQYFNVEQQVYKTLMRAPSLGQYFHDFIQGKYKFQKIR